MHPLVLVLVKHQNVEPFVFVFEWPLELNATIFEGHIESLIFHISDSVESNLRCALSEKDRHHFNILNICHLAEIIHVVVLTHKVDIAEVFESTWVVMVAMNHEDGHGNGEVFVHVIGVWVLIRFE